MILLPLLGGQRMNTVFNYEVDNMFINKKYAIFSPNKVLKHSKPGRKPDQFTYRSFSQKELCVLDTTRISNLQEAKSGGLVVMGLVSQSRGPVFETTLETGNLIVKSKLPP